MNFNWMLRFSNYGMIKTNTSITKVKLKIGAARLPFLGSDAVLGQRRASNAYPQGGRDHKVVMTTPDTLGTSPMSWTRACVD